MNSNNNINNSNKYPMLADHPHLELLFESSKLQTLGAFSRFHVSNFEAGRGLVDAKALGKKERARGEAWYGQSSY